MVAAEDPRAEARPEGEVVRLLQEGAGEEVASRSQGEVRGGRMWMSQSAHRLFIIF